MGFGLLFLGYFASTLMTFHPFGWAFRILGYYLIFSALRRLVEYKHSLSRCVLPLLIMTLCQVYEGAFSLAGIIDPSVKSPVAIGAVVGALFTVISCVFMLFLLGGIRALAEDVEDGFIAGFADKCRLLVAFYTLLNVITTLLSSAFSYSNSFLVLAVSLLSILYPIVILCLLYRCYASICAPEDVDMKPKPSRFGFINKSRELSEKKDAEMQQLIADMQAKKIKRKKK